MATGLQSISNRWPGLKKTCKAPIPCSAWVGKHTMHKLTNQTNSELTLSPAPFGVSCHLSVAEGAEDAIDHLEIMLRRFWSQDVLSSLWLSSIWTTWWRWRPYVNHFTSFFDRDLSNPYKRNSLNRAEMFKHILQHSTTIYNPFKYVASRLSHAVPKPST